MLVSFVKGAPALLIKRERVLVIGDLHIGMNIKLKEAGIYFQGATERLAKNLLELYDKSGAESIAIIGDVKESITSPKFAEYKELKLFFDSLSGIKVMVAKGNHDGDLPKVLSNMGFKIRVEKELLFKDIALMHGNSWPSDYAMMKKYLIMGHGHYALEKDNSKEKIWLETRIARYAKKKYDKFNKNIKLIVVPPFNELISGVSVSRETKGYLPIFKNNIFSFEEAKVYGLKRKFYGKVDDIIS